MAHSTPLLDTSPDSHNSTSQVLWLVRHGESTWNARGLAQGHDDQARLTSRGLRQARAIAVQLRDRPIRALYASDLRRALQTVAPLASALGLTVVRDARLRERCLGVLEGTAAASISPAVSGISDRLVVNPDACPDGGESLRDFYRRVARFADDLAAAGRAGDAGPAWDVGPAGDAGRAGNAGPAGEVVIVAHGGTLRMLTACRQGVPVEEMTWDPLANATVLRSPAR
jgi:2,3-bisphosphoglycerate-dependent phosphoglycerate mutase